MTGPTRLSVRAVEPVLTGASASPKKTSKKQPATRRIKANEQKTEKVLNAALELFSAYGFHGTRIEQVAERADLSKTNLLYYFSSKQALYTAVLQRLMEIWLEPLRSFDAKLDPVVAINNYIRAKLAYSRDHPLASKLYCVEVVQGADILGDLLNEELRGLVDSKAEVIRTWIESGRLAKVDPYHLLFSIWAVTQHYADFAVQISALTGKTLSDEAFFDETVTNVERILLDGIRARDASGSKSLRAPRAGGVPHR